MPDDEVRRRQGAGNDFWRGRVEEKQRELHARLERLEATVSNAIKERRETTDGLRDDISEVKQGQARMYGGLAVLIVVIGVLAPGIWILLDRATGGG